MKKSLKIEGNNDKVLSVSLCDVLAEIIDDNYSWKILILEATGEIENGTILDLEKEINESKSGVTMTFEELTKLSKSLNQTIEILLLGDSNPSNLRRYDNDEEMHANCSYCIELVDSSYWEVTTDNDLSIQNMKENISGVVEYL